MTTTAPQHVTIAVGENSRALCAIRPLTAVPAIEMKPPIATPATPIQATSMTEATRQHYGCGPVSAAKQEGRSPTLDKIIRMRMKPPAWKAAVRGASSCCGPDQGI